MLIKKKMLTKTTEEIFLTHLGDMVRVFRFISHCFSDSVHLDVESQWRRRWESSQMLGHCFQG